MQRLLVVEDDAIICSGVKTFLEGKGYCVDCAGTVTEAREALKKPYQLVILDCNLPDGNGVAFCRKIREKGNTPVIFLTANDTEQDMMEGFLAGCDDYVAKPFSIELLNQRVMAVLRRTGAEKDVFYYKGLTVDFGKMQVFSGTEPVKLSATEYKLLEFLIRNRGQVLTRKSILEKIWDCEESFVDENTLNVHIRRLRQKIEEDTGHPQYILTVFGIGYTFGE
ncbi:DNA-binding response regulator [bacterium D16-51]|nr:DNA-binding response regulator [bacterium D16-59]RKI61785.1 DNA-binding response regulator [bacterium D16-51]